MSKRFIPEVPEDLSVEWLDHVLATTEAGDERTGISSFEMSRLGEGAGFSAQTLRLEIASEDSRTPKTVIAKLPATDRRARGNVEMVGGYEREVRFYRELASELPVATPAACFVDADESPGTPESAEKVARFLDRCPPWLLRLLLALGRFLAQRSRRRSVLILEDLSSLRIGDQVASCSAAEAERVCTQMAKLHARYWQSPRIASLAWLPRVHGSPRVLQCMHRDARAEYDRRYGEDLPRELHAMNDWLGLHGPRIDALLGSTPFTLLHGDFRLDNLFFDDAREGIVLFDWQIAAKGPGVYDLAYFLSSTLSPELPESEALRLVSTYHAGLVSGGVRDYSLERCLSDYQLALLLMLQRVTIAVSDLALANERGAELIDLWNRRLAARLRGLDAEAIVRARETPALAPLAGA